MIAEMKKKRFPNLEAEMARKRVMKTDIANLLHRTNSVITTRMDGTSDWIFWELKAIKQYLETDMPLDELFDEEVIEGDN